MSRLEELLDELCPDGVEYKTIEEIAIDIFRGSGIKRDEVTEEGIPCVRYGEIYTTYGIWFDECVSHTSESSVASKKYFEYGDILFAITGESVEDIAKSCAYVGHDKCLAGGDIVVLKHEQDPKYLSYALSTTAARLQKSKGKVKSKVVHSSVPAIKSIRIPVPPLEVQREIVQILDKFTFLQAELTAELTARNKQYEYYRRQILNGLEAEELELGQVCDFIRGPFGGSLKKECFKDSGYAVYEQQHAIYENLNFRYYIDEDKYQELKRFEVKSGDLIVSCSGTIGKVFIIPEEAPKGVINQALLKLTPLEMVDKKYIKYCFEDKITAELNSSARGGAIKNVPSVSELKKIKILVPSLDKQREVVKRLDYFSRICTDVQKGIPAEMVGREKQYTYYRDKLICFKEKTA